MKTTLFVPILLFAACANPPVENVPVPPPQPAVDTRPHSNTTNDAASDRFLREQVEKKQETSQAEPSVPLREPTNDAASDRFLFEEVLRHQEAARYEERRRAEAESAARAQPTSQTERVVYVNQQQYQAQPQPQQVQDIGPYRPATFPVGTILGGTVGGIIGHQSRHTPEGIAIGSGVGLLLDMLSGLR